MNRELSGFSGANAGLFTYGWSLRVSGNMSFTSGDTLDSGVNRGRFMSGLGMDYRDLVMPHQVHGSRIEAVDTADRGRGAESAANAVADTDALMTRERRVPIGVMTADCLPVFIVAPLVPAVAMVHAGWRSTRGRIAVKAVERMRAEFNARPQGMRCLLGPSIRPCCYEVGGEMAEIFPQSVFESGGALRLDLAAENLRQLIDAGVPEANIFDAGQCTSCSNGAFFSYRREGASCGRMMSVIMLL